MQITINYRIFKNYVVNCQYFNIINTNFIAIKYYLKLFYNS